MGVSPAGTPPVDASHPNGFGGAPRPASWPQGRHIELVVCCRGEVDPRTGYFLDIKAIDRSARGVLADAFARSVSGAPQPEAEVLTPAADLLDASLGGGRLASLRWNVTPTYSVEVQMENAAGTHLPPRAALLRQKFEIAAAHRLHVPELSDEENHRLFGRCANPSAHGHNYIIEPCVRVPVGAHPPFGLADLERATVQVIIDPFDHRNLNVDCRQFDQSRGGVNPSVENISRVFFELLAPRIAAHGGGVELRSVTVWETEKTSSTFPA